MALLIPYRDKGEQTKERADEIIMEVRRIRQSIKPEVTITQIKEWIDLGRKR